MRWGLAKALFGLRRSAAPCASGCPGSLTQLMTSALRRCVQLYELWDREKPKDDHMVLYGMLLKKQIVAAGVVTPPFGNPSPTAAGAAASTASRPGAPTHGRNAATPTPLHGVPSAPQQRGGPTTPRDAAEPRHSHLSNLIQQPSSSNSHGYDSNAGTSSNVRFHGHPTGRGGCSHVL